MKIKSLYVKKFKGLKDFKIDFNDGVTVLIGENGTGKTTILELLYATLCYFTGAREFNNNLMSIDNNFESCEIILNLERESKIIPDLAEVIEGDANNIKLSFKKSGIQHISIGQGGEVLNILNHHNTLLVNKITKLGVLYLPTEVNFAKHKVENIKKMDMLDSQSFGYVLDSTKLSIELKDFLVYQHYRDLEDNGKGKKGNRIKKYMDLYNSFYEDKEFIGIDNLVPLFKIKETGETHSVDELSSGEKQVFFRAGAILAYGLENSFIFVDEPEISMHPEWQQKILDFYRKVAGNNQLIIATHSPHIVSSCKKEEVRVLVKDKDKIIVEENVDGTYGRTVEQLLLSVFDLKTVRDTKIQEKLDEFKNLYINQEKINEQQRIRMTELKIELYKYLDPNDPELSLVDIDEATKKLKSLMDELKVN